MKLVVLVGPPGSGKSTLSRTYEAEGFLRINQDDQGGDHIDMFLEAIDKNQDIVVDRMNFNKEQRSRYLDQGKLKGYETEIIVLHQPYAVCLERAIVRTDHPTIKDEETAKKALAFFFSHYSRVTDDEANKVTRIWPEGRKSSAIIVDLDGTLCNIEHRLHYVQRDNGKKDWRGFFKDMDKDLANKWCVELINKFAYTHEIVFCSGRPNYYQAKTEKWLDTHIKQALQTDYSLYMRQGSDHRQDFIVKENLLDFEILTRYQPLFFVDDRKQVVDMWRSRGYVCLACDEGNF